MPQINIILTGFMATGKTTIGKLLAKRLNYEFVDTDEWIANQAEMSIPEIFKQKGEGAFRQMESDLAVALGNKKGLVVSTGGRMMLDPANAEALGRQGLIFCLVATPEEIFARVAKDGPAKRPMLDAPDPMQRMLELIKEREEGYRGFRQIMTSNRTPDEVALDLIDLIHSDTRV